MTYVGNIHTLPIGGVDPVGTLVGISERQVVELTRDMMSSTGVLVPIGVDTVGSMDLLVTIVVFLRVARPAVFGRMSLLVADLTRDVNPGGSAATSSATASPPSGGATASTAARGGVLTIVTPVVAAIITTIGTVATVTAITAVTTRAIVVVAVGVTTGARAPLAIRRIGRGLKLGRR
jgi:hypothetical protein